LDAAGEVDRSDRVFASVPVLPTYREGLVAARTAWIEEVDDGDVRKQRAKDRDFLADKNSDGRVLDFHSLRVTCGTALARAGVRLQEAQRLMRHSTPVLTANVDIRLELHDLRRAVNRLPDVDGNPRQLAPRRPPSPLHARTSVPRLAANAALARASRCGTVIKLRLGCVCVFGRDKCPRESRRALPQRWDLARATLSGLSAAASGIVVQDGPRGDRIADGPA